MKIDIKERLLQGAPYNALHGSAFGKFIYVHMYVYLPSEIIPTQLGKQFFE